MADPDLELREGGGGEVMTDNMASVLIMTEELLKIKASSASLVHRCTLLMKEYLSSEKLQQPLFHRNFKICA